jgi:serine/threonine-protein kinase
VGDWESALSRLRRAAALDPRSARAARRYANTLLNLRRYAEADQANDKAIGLAPTDIASFQQKVMVAVARGDLVEARRLVRAAPVGIDSTELIVYFATFEDLWWVLDDAQQRRLLTLPPSAFDDSRAAWGLVLAQVFHHRGEARKARAYADSAVLGFEQQVREAPNDGPERVLLGLALAYAGRAGDAVREGERGFELQMTRDALFGHYIQQQLARIYLLIGEHDKALDRLEPLLEVPHTLSPGWLRIDPTWDALRQHPRFQRLVEGARQASSSH